MRNHFSAIRVAKNSLKLDNILCCEGHRKRGTPTLLVGMKKGIISMEGNLAISNKTVFASILGPNDITSLKVYSEDMPPKYENTSCTSLLIAAVCNDEILETI